MDTSFHQIKPISVNRHLNSSLSTKPSAKIDSFATAPRIAYNIPVFKSLDKAASINDQQRESKMKNQLPVSGKLDYENTVKVEKQNKFFINRMFRILCRDNQYTPVKNYGSVDAAEQEDEAQSDRANSQ